MTNDKVNEVVDLYLSSCLAPFDPVRADTSQLLPLDGSGMLIALRHAKWMAGEIRVMGPERLQKKFRWLGFLQAILWMTGIETINGAKETNRPNDHG